jgi:hypothetical protein
MREDESGMESLHAPARLDDHAQRPHKLAIIVAAESHDDSARVSRSTLIS